LVGRGGSRQRQIHVTYDEFSGTWLIRRNNEGIMGAANRKSDALMWAKITAEKEKRELVIHSMTGEIQDADSFGNESPVIDKIH
jgi:hypothetical protein